jgi:thiamine biosynthesis lipoprotein
MIHKRTFFAMGSHVSVMLDSPASQASGKLERVPGWFEDWERRLSRFRADSELNWVNDRAGQAVRVSETFRAVFLAAREAYQASDGLVTPAVLEALVRAGYDRSFASLISEGQAAAGGPGYALTVPVPPMEEIEWDAAGQTVCLPLGTRLDFGGVAKGWAAHQAAQRLRLYGTALVDAGGDIAISGLKMDGQAWPVGIVDPFNPEEDLEVVLLGRCGIATSGRDFRFWKTGNESRHHLIDPRTGRPAETDVLSATVIAPDVLTAEMAAKVILISGSREGMEWLERRPACSGLVVLESGERHYSRNFGRWKER